MNFKKVGRAGAGQETTLPSKKQLWGVSSRSPQQNGMIILMIVAVFLVGMGIGDIVSKTKQANTHYAALTYYPNGHE